MDAELHCPLQDKDLIKNRHQFSALVWESMYRYINSSSFYWQLGPNAKLSLKDMEHPWRYFGAYGHHSEQAEGGQETFPMGNTPHLLLILAQE